MSNTLTNECGPSVAGDPVIRKFQQLLNSTAGLGEVRSHLIELMQSIGINHPPEACMEEAKKIEEPTLISTLNSLPDRVRNEVDLIHKMIDEIKSELN